MSVITPELLLDRIAEVLSRTQRHGDSVVILDLNTGRPRMVVLRYSSFCGFFLKYDEPMQFFAGAIRQSSGPAQIAAAVRRDLPDEPDAYRAILYCGELTTRPEIIEGIHLVLPNSYPLIESDRHGSLSDAADLNRYFQHHSIAAFTPHELSLITVRYDTSSQQLTNDRATIYDANTRIEAVHRQRALLGRADLTAPVVGKPFLLVFEEQSHGNWTPDRFIWYLVIAEHRNFSIQIEYDPQERDWALRLGAQIRFAAPEPEMGWHGERVEELKPLPLPTLPRVTLREDHPQVVLVVESTLGTRRDRIMELENNPPEDSTDFDVVGAICRALIENMYFLSDNRYLVLLFGGHPQPSQEFMGSARRASNPVVRHLPNPNRAPVFVMADKMLKELDANKFSEYRTVTRSWAKSADEALHKLNEGIPWGYSDRVVIFIIQSPPFDFAEGEAPPLDKPGFAGKYSFVKEFARLRDSVNGVGARVMVIFIEGNDLALGRAKSARLIEEARIIWEDVVDPDHFFVHRAAEQGDALLPDEIITKALSLADYGRKTTLIGKDENRLILPFEHIQGDEVIYIES